MSESNGKLLCVIEDGYTVPFYFSAVEGVHPAFRGHYRALSGAQRARFLNQYARSGVYEDTYQRAAADLVARQLVDWDIRSKDGKILEITGGNVLNKLTSGVNGKLADLIIAGAKCDPDPEPQDAVDSSHYDADLEAVLAGKTKEEIAEKNSEPAPV